MKQLKAVLGGIGAFIFFILLFSFPIPTILGILIYFILMEEENE